MKKSLLIVAIAGLAFAACKKDRECTCTVSSTEPGYTTTTSNGTVLKATKKTAKDVCVKTSYDDVVFSGSTTNTYVVTQDCKLK